MIEINNVSKSFGTHPAVKDLSLRMQEHEVFGMVGTNGAGKTTLLRMMCGVLQPDAGEIRIDGESVYDNPKAKSKIFFIPDDPYFFPNSTPVEMGEYYRSVYSDFDMTRFLHLLNNFQLDKKRKISGFSKGMKKQLAIILGISSCCKYLFCDETFDGLDPVMRQATKSLFAKDMEERGLTPILTSHNLRELEDICDHVGLLHQGGALLSKDINDMKLSIQKVQVVFANEEQQHKFEQQCDVLIHKMQGKLHVYTVRKSHAELEMIMGGISTIFCEMLPLTLEEIFISETEVVGYDIRKIILA
ncbi:MAG: ABC transporter ATP-binding protein [Lachnospiraceae bacterium]|nr:ABC transporter ATP-binding protein [Lachnospiraceae bacterium]